MILERGPIITPLLIFYLSQSLIFRRINFFIQYNPEKCFSPFVHSIVEARR